VIIACSPDPNDAAHVRRALALYDRHLRSQGRRLPASLRGDICHVPAATDGQDRTARDLTGDEVDGDPVQLLLTYAEAGRRLNVSERGVRRLVAAGELPVKRIGRRALVDPADLAAFVATLPTERTAS
jgi:excisionase family DNA binding protein